MNKILTKVSRITAYIMIPVFIFILITGYRSTDNFTFISRGVANALHIVYLNIFFLMLVCIHSLTAIRSALWRNNVRGRYIDVILIITGVVFSGGFAYFAFN